MNHTEYMESDSNSETPDEIRVLQISATKYGVENVIKNISEDLSDSGISLHHMTHADRSVPDCSTKIPLLNPHILKKISNIRLLYLCYGIFYFWWSVYNMIAKNHEEFDIIWLHNPRLIFLLPSELEEKIGITFHSHLRYKKAEFHNFPEGLYYRLIGSLERRGLVGISQTNFSVVNSDLQEQLLDIGIESDRITLIKNGVDTDVFKPAANAGTDPYGEFDTAAYHHTKFLYVGKLADVKRPVELIEVFDSVSEQTDRDIGLYLAGDGPLRRKLERKLQTLSEDNVHALGFVEPSHLPALYATADYFMISSRYDPGGPLVLFEALSSGLPCIVSDIPQFQFISDNSCGIQIDYKTPEKAANDIKKFIETDVAEMRQNAREYAQQNLSWESKTKEYSHWLQYIVKN